LKTITKRNQPTDGGLLFIGYGTQHYMLPKQIKNEGNSHIVNLGILFQSHFRHVVLPHFSDEDRIGIAFNALGLTRMSNLTNWPYISRKQIWITTWIDKLMEVGITTIEHEINFKITSIEDLFKSWDCICMAKSRMNHILNIQMVVMHMTKLVNIVWILAIQQIH